jgi:DNA-binding response OmpR family regulator
MADIDARAPYSSGLLRRVPGTSFPLRVIVAEDEESAREAAVATFLGDGDDVVVLESAAELTDCLNVISRQGLRSPDLIVVGATTAPRAELDLVEWMRAAGWTTPVVLLSWLLPRDVQVRLARADGMAVVTKPFNAAELRRAALYARFCKRAATPASGKACPH